MNVVVELRLPPGGFALGELFSYRSDARIELERIVPTGEGTMPFFWVVGDDPTFVDDVDVEDSPIVTVEVLRETGNSALCRAVWSPDQRGIHGILTDQGATLLDVEGCSDGWSFRIRFPDHEATTRFREACDEQSIPYEVRRIYSLTELSTNGYDLTDAQREALVTAFERGYFRVPRETSLSELAEMLEISPQATSGRLRRGLERMLDGTLSPPGDSMGDKDTN
ncbi:helix-turn-helix domain-containing protein [Haladaptatus halobius]|uniref:helix-turn-helix domain-containing protein n=1 Tax=Haladaptatus halobius TaxID=2884875 RepID=UPI001D0A8338|nr:helix-turn-helix domain-containing protein [Haladaptatus halobius]